jgi:hypothetical protein
MSAAVILIIAIAATGILLMRFRKATAGENQHRLHQPDHRVVRRLVSGFRHSHARRSQIGQGLPNPGERLSSTERLHHRAHLQQPIRVREERARGGRLRS